VLGNVIDFQRLKSNSGTDYPELQLNMVLIRSNVHEAPDLVRIAHRLGARCVEFHHAVPTNGIDLGEAKLEHHPALFNACRRKVLELGEQFGLDIVIPDAFPGFDASADIPESDQLAPFEALLDRHQAELPAVENPVVPPERGSFGLESFRPNLFCDLPFRELFVVEGDKVMPCPFQSQVSASLVDHGNLKNVYFSREFVELRKAMTTSAGHPGCAGCPRKQGLV
jgi:MoaA/NifB/PqqE/SkfB family radical SAM enzyme